MDIFAQQLVNGLVLGSVYALVALGYTLVYGILELINFAHGETTMMGSMIALAVIGALFGVAPDLPGIMIVLAGLLVAIPACMLLGYSIERVAYRPLRHAPRLAPLITAIGLSIVLQNVAMLIWGKQYIAFPTTLLPQGRHEILGATITDVQIAILVLTVVIMFGLVTLVNRTRLGRAMRATAQAPAVAQLMGVNVNQVISATFIIGSALRGDCGCDGQCELRTSPLLHGLFIGLESLLGSSAGWHWQPRRRNARRLIAGRTRSLGRGLYRRFDRRFLGKPLSGYFRLLGVDFSIDAETVGLAGE